MCTESSVKSMPEPPSVAVVGSGPAGLTCATLFARGGARVKLFEMRPDPRLVALDDARSFSLTLAGLAFGADPALEPAIRDAGQRVVGRAVYAADGEVVTTPYGLKPYDQFVAIPRSRLQQIQLRRAEALGVQTHFDCEVLDAEVNDGVIHWRCGQDAHLLSATFDLLVFADGVNGIGRRLLENRPSNSVLKLVDGTEYVRARIEPAETARAGLPRDRISFWPGAGGPAVGIPDREGALDLLIMGKLPGDFEEPPFGGEDEAAAFLGRRNRHLPRAVPGIAAQLAGARRGHFVYAMSSDWRIGRRAVAIGDAVRCAPPYSGIGGGAAMDDAALLVRIVLREPDLQAALRAFEADRCTASRIVQRMIVRHGRFLKVRLGSPVWHAGARLGLARERLTGHRTLYQRIVFEPGGLARLMRGEPRGGCARTPAFARDLVQAALI